MGRTVSAAREEDLCGMDWAGPFGLDNEACHRILHKILDSEKV